MKKDPIHPCSAAFRGSDEPALPSQFQLAWHTDFQTPSGAMDPIRVWSPSFWYPLPNIHPRGPSCRIKSWSDL